MSIYTKKHAVFVSELRSEGFSWREIEAEFFEEFGINKSHDTLRMNALKYDTDRPLTQEERPKVLIYDIETAPMLGYVWSLWDNNVGLNQLHQDWSILSYAAKWLDGKEIFYDDQRNAKDIHDESKLLKGIWKLLNEADIVITHNGKRFDEKKLNARFLKFGLKPLGKKKHIDTLVIAKREFAFTSNKLEYLTKQFCIKNKKKSHGKFPGFQLWLECLKGNKKAWNEMKDYNIADITSLEELYYKLAPYDNTVNFNLFHDREVTFCTCGHNKFSKNGFTYSNSGKYQKYTCKKCSNNIRGKDNLLSKNKRKSLKGKLA